MKGVYIVLFRLEESLGIDVGALGRIFFESGFYVYVGSGQTNVEKRVERHVSGRGKKHWHIDYLREHVAVDDYFILPEDSSYECRIASILSSLGDPVDEFGSSDCGCSSHLFRFPLDFSP